MPIDLSKFDMPFTTVKGSNDPGPISWVFTKADVQHLIEVLRTSEVVSFDLETTGLDEHAVTGGLSNKGVSARVALAQFTLPQMDSFGQWDGDNPTTYLLPLSHPNSPWLGQWRKILRVVMRTIVKHRRPMIGHNVKFDCRWTYATTGVDISERVVWDTQVGAHLLDENASTKLKVRAPEVFGIPPWDDHDLTYPGAAEDVDMWELGEYGARDTYWTWRLWQFQRDVMFVGDVDVPPMDAEEAIDARIGTVATWVAMPTVVSLTKIEQRGMRLDIPWVEEHLEEMRTKASTSLDELASMYGMDRATASAHATANWFKAMVDQAVEAGELRIAALTDSGNPQWSKAVLRKQARLGSKTAELILASREGAKSAEFLSSWLEKATPEGFIHATYWPGRVLTGRLSASDPNMQQVSKSLRPAFIPSEGHYIADLDYSQLELRVAAFISRSEPMLQAFAEGRDLHRMLAATIVNKRLEHESRGRPFELILPEEVSGEDRQAGKSANFGLLYDQSVKGFQTYAEDVYGVVLTEQEAAIIHEAFFEQWTGMREWHQKVKAEVQRNGQVISPLGRVRRLPSIWDRNSSWASKAERQAINSPVQGFGADLMNMAAASIQGILYDTKAVAHARPVGTVHDSLITEVEIDHWQEAVEECQYRMEHLDRELAKMGVELDVPLVADATVGTRWSLNDIAGED